LQIPISGIDANKVVSARLSFQSGLSMRTKVERGSVKLRGKIERGKLLGTRKRALFGLA
jgi:hypothetical protein